MPKFLRRKKIFRQTQGILWYDYFGPMSYELGRQTGFKPDILDGIYGGGFSVLLDQIQLAYYMGFQTVYVIGVDFSFKVSSSTETTCEQGEVLSSDGEVNHFHKDYRKPGETWTMPRLELQELAFKYARDAFEKDGRTLLNASRESKLEVLERVNLDDVLGNSKTTISLK